MTKIKHEYHAATQLVRYVPTNTRFVSDIAHADALRFIEQATGEGSFLKGQTTFSKPARDAMLACVKDYSKVVLLAVVDELCTNYKSILAGARFGGANVNDFIINAINELKLIMAPIECVLARTSSQDSYLFYFLEKEFVTPGTSPINKKFLVWLKDQPLDTLSAFVHKKKSDILFDVPNACEYMMRTFDEDNGGRKWALYDILNDTVDGNKFKAATYADDAQIRKRLSDDLVKKLCVTPTNAAKIIKPATEADPEADPDPEKGVSDIAVPPENIKPDFTPVPSPVPTRTAYVPVHGGHAFNAFMPSWQQTQIPTPWNTYAPPYGGAMSGKDHGVQVTFTCGSIEEAVLLMRYAETFKNSTA